MTKNPNEYSFFEHLYNEGMEHLKSVLMERETYMGIKLNELIARFSNHFRVVVAQSKDWPDAFEDYPYIILEKQPG